MHGWMIWAVSAVLLMFGCPWLAVTFLMDSAMAVCFLLFYVVNPVFSALWGGFAGKNIRKYWLLPILTAACFLAGAWTFFSVAEPAFLLYCGCYLLIGLTAMGIRALVTKRKL